MGAGAASSFPMTEAGHAVLVASRPVPVRTILATIGQQAENPLLQPVILSRTVKLNPLTVLLAILIAAEVAGILGALLAIPVTGIIQVVLGDVWAQRHGRPLGLPSRADNSPENADRSDDPE
jgi:predicted PurR-regulated permease PerM